MYRTYEDMPKIKMPSHHEVKISDSTLRDGAQMPGIVLKKAHKLRIYDYLHEIGIEKTEVFLYNERDRNAVRDMLGRGYDTPEVTGWARAVPKDIDLVLDTDGIKETGILMSVSDVHIFDKMGLNSREKAEEKYLNALQYAVDHGLRARCHLEDITRADFKGFITPFVKKIVEIAPDALIRVCDTVNYGLPFPEVDLPYSIPKMIKLLKDLGVKDIETHIHDDFGLGLSNTLAGYWYGANWSNLTFLGIGERAGNTEMEKILIFLICRVEGFQKYNPKSLVKFAEYMENEIGVRVPRNKSIVGKNVFVHESGIHTAGIIKNPFTYEPFPPELVGGKRELMIGDSSGNEVIRYKVEEALKGLMHLDLSIDKNDPRIQSIKSDIQKLYDEESRVSCISDEELRAYAEKYFILEPIVEKDISKEEE
ncbi:MAG: isopropylmalate synthase [Methanocellales archaeon]|nr:isopropylmalate synthase [Methanocellales archaeon]